MDLDQRIPEPELMDDAEQAEAYASADFAEPHQAFVTHFGQRFEAFVGGRVLDLGCGPADVTTRFARAYPEARVLGLDGAAAMLDRGRQLVRRLGLEPRVTLEQVLLPDDKLGRGEPFDAVISNSLLHHLADPAVLWHAVRACAGAGAPVWVMDLCRPASDAEAAALVQQHAADAPELLRRDFYNSLLAAYRPHEVQAQLAAAGLPRLTVEQLSDRHLIVWG